MKKRAYWEGNKLTSSEFWDENGNEIIYPVDICTGVYLSSRYMYRSRIMTSNKSLADVCVVIQARLNSQRVPKKMIRDFNGTNLFSLVIDKVLKSEIISKKNFYVSVYEEELKDIAKVQCQISFTRDQTWSFEDFDQNESNDLIAKFREKELPGLVVFTSGSTGKKKGILENTALEHKFYEISAFKKCGLSLPIRRIS
mgnify:CR=1 FL=1